MSGAGAPPALAFRSHGYNQAPVAQSKTLRMVTTRRNPWCRKLSAYRL